MKKKKIVVLHPWLIMGGEEKVLINMLNVLDYDKVDVTLWILEPGGVLEKNLTKNVKIKYLDYQKFLPENSLSRLLKVQLKNLKFFSALRCIFYLVLCHFIKDPSKREFYRLRGYGYIDRKKYDLFIEFHCYRQDLLYLGLTSFKAKKRAIWLHGSDYLHPDPDLRRYGYGRYNNIFAVSQAVKNEFIERYPEFTDKTDIFYNIQDIDDILKKSEAECDVKMIHPAIVTVGRISHEKGMDRILECMKILIADGYNPHWYIVGDGPEREMLETECEANGLAGNIHFLGEKQNPYPFMKNADIYVQPSRSEGFCLTVFEAKILRKPIVVSNIPVMREQFVNGETAIITKDQTPTEIAKAIESLLDSPALCQKFIDNISADYPGNAESLNKLYSLLN